MRGGFDRAKSTARHQPPKGRLSRVVRAAANTGSPRRRGRLQRGGCDRWRLRRRVQVGGAAAGGGPAARPGCRGARRVCLRACALPAESGFAGPAKRRATRGRLKAKASRLLHNKSAPRLQTAAGASVAARGVHSTRQKGRWLRALATRIDAGRAFCGRGHLLRVQRACACARKGGGAAAPGICIWGKCPKVVARPLRPRCRIAGGRCKTP